jgi:hypothetical protein
MKGSVGRYTLNILALLLRKWEKLRSILGDSTRPTELSLCTLKMLWGVWLLLPMQTLSERGTLASTAPERAWGLGLLLLGLLQLVMLLWGWRRARMVLAMLAILFWWFLTAISWQRSPGSAGAVLTAWVALANIWVFIRLAQEAPGS